MMVWDVNHGLAVYVNSPNGRHIAIDLGTGCHKTGKEFSPLLHLKKSWKMDKLDYLVITHPHVDHLDDILNLSSEMEPKVLCRPTGIKKESVLEGIDEARKPKVEKFFEINDRFTYPIAVDSPNNPAVPENWGGLSIQTFYPGVDSDNINNLSVVTVFEYAGIKIVVPGDNEPVSWEALLKKSGFEAAIKDADILIAPHHGRESGYHADVVKLVNPRLTIVSDKKEVETSASSKYSAASRGWKVHKGNDDIDRKCITTRTDGWVKVEWGNNSASKPFLSVSIAE